MLILAAVFGLLGTAIQACLASNEGEAAIAARVSWVDKIHVVSWGVLFIAALLVLIDAL